MKLLPVDVVRRRYLLLLALRWLAVGLVIPVQALLPLERGLSLAQLGVVMAIQGFVVLGLELPTGGLTDAWGRRPVLVLASVIGVVATTVYVLAHSFAWFCVASALMGVFRALDSGPLEAWYVDATHATRPDYPIERGLSAGNAVLSVAIAAGSALALPLITWRPFDGMEPLALPVVAAVVIQVVLIPLTWALLTELRPAGSRPGMWAGVRDVPRVIGGGVTLLRRSKVLLALVSVELFWSFGMPAFESLTPVRLAEILGGDADRAAAVIGPAGAAAWGASAAGSAVALLLSRWWGVAASAALLRIVQGATVVTMGLVGGVVGLLTAFFACYLVHGASNALHSTLLHRQVGPDHRATVVSLNSMVSQPAASVGVLVLTAIAGASGVSWSFVVAGVVIALAAPLYLPARRAERAAVPDPA